MTRKTIQFKLPPVGADAASAVADVGDAGRWVAEAASPAYAAFTAVVPGPAGNDQPTAEAGRPAQESAPPHSGRAAARAFGSGLGALAESGVVLALGAQAVSREWLEAPLDAAQNGFDALALLRCRTLSEVVAAETALVQASLERALGRNRRVARITLEAFGEAARAMMPAPARHG